MSNHGATACAWQRCRKRGELVETASAFTGVIADVKRVKRRAWERVAHEEGLQLPTSSGDFIFDKIYDMRLERAVTEVWCHPAKGIIASFCIVAP